jgi:hypothetical protein
MQAATAYKRGSQIFVHSSSRTTAGVWLLSEPVAAVAMDDAEELGRRIRDALDASKDQVPHPKSWKNLFDPVLHLAGVKSWNTFVKSAKCVEIEAANGVVRLIPTQNLGADDGFSPLLEKAASCEASPDKLGATLLMVMRDSI